MFGFGFELWSDALCHLINSELLFVSSGQESIVSDFDELWRQDM